MGEEMEKVEENFSFLAGCLHNDNTAFSPGTTAVSDAVRNHPFISLKRLSASSAPLQPAANAWVATNV